MHVDSKSENNEIIHNESIVSQFTKQAIPFAHMSQHSNEYGLKMMLKLSGPKEDDTGIRCSMWSWNCIL